MAPTTASPSAPTRPTNSSASSSKNSRASERGPRVPSPSWGEGQTEGESSQPWFINQRGRIRENPANADSGLPPSRRAIAPLRRGGGWTQDFGLSPRLANLKLIPGEFLHFNNCLP